MKGWILPLALCPLMTLAQNQLTISVEGVASSDGNIGIGLYNSADSFPDDDKVYKGLFESAQKGTTVATFDDLPSGTYALAIYHDENANKKLDKNVLGVPKEPLGFSKASLKTFGPPSFKECSFEVDSDFKITVPLE